MEKQVLIGGVWLLNTTDRLKVLVEVDGVWRVAIDEARPQTVDGLAMIVSHYAHAAGFADLPPEPMFADDVERADPIRWNPLNKVVQDHRDGTIHQVRTNVARIDRRLPTPWKPEMAAIEALQPPVY